MCALLHHARNAGNVLRLRARIAEQVPKQRIVGQVEIDLALLKIWSSGNQRLALWEMTEPFGQRIPIKMEDQAITYPVHDRCPEESNLLISENATKTGFVLGQISEVFAEALRHM